MPGKEEIKHFCKRYCANGCLSQHNTWSIHLFQSGKDASKPKRDDFSKHEKSDDHKALVAAEEMRPDMRKATNNAYSKAKDCIIAQMATVLVQAMEDLPTSKNAALVKLQIFNVSIF